MTLASLQTGQRGEHLAQSILRQKGFEIVNVNWRSPHCVEKLGEIDIIARHPEQQLLLFVEVKTRKSARYGSPLEAITPKKQQQLIMLAEIYLSLHPIANTDAMRFDVISIYYAHPKSPAEILHIEGAF